MRHLALLPTRSFRGFTLVELLITVAIILTLGGLGLAGIRGAMAKAKQSKCANNLRQIGIGFQLYADDHHGRLPETTHTVSRSEAWIYQLEGYLGNFDEVRICPADPKAEQRLAAKGTSYVLNSFVFVPELDPFGNTVGSATRLTALPWPERTILAFTASDRMGVGPGNDHTHSDLWTTWDAVTRDIQPDRHPRRGGGVANYLYADGSVRAIPAMEVKRRISRGENIAEIPR